MAEPVIHQSVVAVLEQGAMLLRSLDDDGYQRTVSEASNATIGAHYRHCIEHFEQLLDGEPSEVDYDARLRDRSIEGSREVALERTERLMRRASEMDRDHGEPVQVRCAFVDDDAEVPVVGSTLGREIGYAVIHAVHHYALIGIMCRIQGIELPEGFGVAPSTRRHERALEKASGGD